MFSLPEIGDPTARVAPNLWDALERVDCVADDLCQWFGDNPEAMVFVRQVYRDAVERGLERLADERLDNSASGSAETSSTPSESAGHDHSIHAEGPRMDA